MLIPQIDTSKVTIKYFTVKYRIGTKVCFSNHDHHNPLATCKEQKVVTIKSTLRLDFIDATRGIAACLVMLQHSLYQSGLLGSLRGFIPRYLELGETGVVAFFFVSGFIIPMSLEKVANLKIFWAHRALRIYPLYLLIYFITFMIRTPYQNLAPRDVLFNLFSHLLFIQEYVNQESFVGGSWTLSLEIIWYLGISISFAFVNRGKHLLMFLSCVIFSALAGFICSLGYHFPMGRISMIICCVMGYVCYQFRYSKISLIEFWTLSILLALTIFANILIGMKLYPSQNPTSSFNMVVDSWFIAGVVLFVPFFTSHSSFWSSKILLFLGKISYSIYLVHGFVLGLFYQFNVTGVFLIIATFTATMALSKITYILVEVPPIRFARSLKLTN